MSNQFMFADEASQQTTKLPTEYWKILIVDDEPEARRNQTGLKRF